MYVWNARYKHGCYAQMVVALRERYKESDEDCFDRIVKSRTERYGEAKKLKALLRDMITSRNADMNDGGEMASFSYHWPVKDPVCFVSY